MSPQGIRTGDGTISRPIDLATALSSSGPVAPGDTVWLHQGTYVGAFTSALAGTASAPIGVRAYPGERVTIDGRSPVRADILVVNGFWTTYEGIEVTNSYPQRVLSSVGSNPPDRRGIGVNVFGPNNRFVNMIVHDAGDGFGVWKSATNTEVSGSVIFANGWEAPDRGHGHGIYVQNTTGTQRLLDNIIFNQFSNGIHAFGSAVRGIHAEGNVLFNNGVLSLATGLRRNILLGGGTMAIDSALVSNFTYFGSNTTGENNIGYDAGCVNVLVFGNYFSRGYHPMRVFNCTGLDVRQNVIHFGGPMEPGFDGRYPGNTVYHAGRPPSGVQTFVRPNPREAGRGHIVVYNWASASQAAVDPSTLLSVGEPYEVRDAQDIFGEPVATGVYTGGTISLPLSGLTVAPPVGNVPVMPQHTAPQFAAFVLTRWGTSAPPPPAPPPVPPPAPPPPLSADVAVAANRSDAQGTAGANVTYRFDVRNGGPSASGATLQTGVPSGAAFVSASASQGSCSGTANVTCNLGQLTSGATGAVTFVVRPSAAGNLTASASVTSAVTDPNPSNNSASASATIAAPATQGADLAVAAVASATQVVVGGRLTYTFTVSNVGRTTALGVSFRTTLPGTVTWQSSSASRGGCSAGPAVTCSLGSLATGKVANVTIVTTAVSAGAAAATGVVSSDAADPQPANNTVTVSAVVNR